MLKRHLNSMCWLIYLATGNRKSFTINRNKCLWSKFKRRLIIASLSLIKVLVRFFRLTYWITNLRTFWNIASKIQNHNKSLEAYLRRRTLPQILKFFKRFNRIQTLQQIIASCVREVPSNPLNKTREKYNFLIHKETTTEEIKLPVDGNTLEEEVDRIQPTAR